MKLLLLILPIFLFGCGHTPPQDIIVHTVFAPVVCEEFNPIAGINPLPVKFVEAIDMKGNNVLGLTGASYSNLSINSKDTLRYLKEQKKAINYYEKCISDHNTKAAIKNEEGRPE